MKPSVTIFDIVYEEDQATLYSILSNSDHNLSPTSNNIGNENQLEFSCHVRRGVLDYRDEPVYELVHFVGYFRTDANSIEVDDMVSSTNRYAGNGDSMSVTFPNVKKKNQKIVCLNQNEITIDLFE